LCDFIGKERVGKSVWSGGGDKGKKSKEKGCEWFMTKTRGVAYYKEGVYSKYVVHHLLLSLWLYNINTKEYVFSITFLYK